jgi:integrase
MAATEPIRSKTDIKRMVNYYLNRGETRNYVLIVLGVHSALRISDLLHLRWEDVLEPGGELKSHVTVTEQKTGKTKSIALNKAALRALKYIHADLDRAKNSGEYIF